MTKIVFMGTPEFSVPVLTMLHEEGYTIVAVVTQPDRPVGRKRVLTPPPVKEEALRLGLACHSARKVDSFGRVCRNYCTRTGFDRHRSIWTNSAKGIAGSPAARLHQCPCISIAEIPRRCADPSSNHGRGN